jgi:drug/metabolite transporter (DMT)-like permease
MTTGMAFALAAMLCFGLADLVYKRASATGVPAHHLMLVQAWCFGPSITIYAWLTHTLAFGWSAVWGALAGLFAFVGFLNFARSLGTGSISVLVPIFRLNFALTALLAISFLGESVSATKLAGLLAALVAVWLLLGAPSKHRVTDRRALTQVLIAFVLVGASNLFYKVGLRAGALPETLLVAQAAAFNACALTFALVVDRGLSPLQYNWRTPALAAVVLVIAFVLLLHSLTVGEASIYVPVAQMGFVVTAAIGIVVWGEALTARKLVGLGVAVGALVLLAAS